MYTKTCKQCNEEFESKINTRKFCGRNCVNLSQTFLVKNIIACGGCGEDFQQKYPTQKYCSPECCISIQKKVCKKICKYCGEEFMQKVKAQIFCNKSCANTKENNHNYNKKFTKHHRKLLSEAKLRDYASGKQIAPKRCGLYYNDIWVGSKWELDVAKILDKNKIKWIKDYPLEYKTRNKSVHTFLLDFYLPDFGVGIEVKSDYTVKLGGEREVDKIKFVKENYPWISWLWTKKDCQEFDVSKLIYHK